MQNPFTPSGTVTVSVTNSTGNARLTSQNPVSVRLYNAGAATVFFRVGKSDVEATTADTPIPAGAIEVFNLTPSATGSGEVTHIAAITAASTATLYATVGQGI